MQTLAGKIHLPHALCLLMAALVLFTLMPRAAQGATVDSQLMQRLAHKVKIKEHDRVLQGLRAGQPRTRVIVRLQDGGQTIGPGKATAKDINDRHRRQQLRSEVSARVGNYLAKFAKSEVESRASFAYMAGFGAEVTAAGLERLADDAEVVAIEEDVRLSAHLQQGIPLIKASMVRGTVSGAGLAIAICDTGIDYTHPRLGGGGFPNAKVIGGYDTGQEDSDPMDANGHGTACAGIAAGDLGTTADYIGGVAPGAKLYALKITDSATGGSAWTSDIIQAWEWTITHQFDNPANPIMIISTSFGGGRYLSNCDASQLSLATAAANANNAGIAIFVSAGNEGYCDALGSPACVSRVISVGAVYDAAFGWYYPCVEALSCVTKTAHAGCATGYYAQDNSAADRVTSFSNTASFLTLLAPANKAYTTDIKGSGGYSSNDYTPSFGGTSAAAPYAAGGGALLQSAAQAGSGAFLSAEELKIRLLTAGDPIADPKAPAVNKPRINLDAAAALDADGDGVPDLQDALPANPNETADADGDGVGDNADLCPAGNDTMDGDGDLVPDACDALPTVAGEWRDTDGDGVGDNRDNCVGVANADQLDTDHDAMGNACDSTVNQANYGAVLAAPHNETRGIRCASCHSYSLWWQYSPVSGADPLYPALATAMCTPCHGQGGAGQWIKEGHGSAAMGGRHREALGTWAVTCIDCHDPHDQGQLEWRTTDAQGLYLVTGTIAGQVTVQGGETTFAYTADQVKAEWSDRATWGRKNGLAPASGLILVLDLVLAKNTFAIIAADAATITVKGGLDPAATGSTFGIIYGQAIKAHIQMPAAESRAAKFFNPLDPAGGFTDHNSPVTGICQICHRNTLYWNAQGTALDNAAHSGFGQSRCTDCHLPTLGFRPLL